MIDASEDKHAPARRPKDAAVLVLVRRDGAAPRLLMGRRHTALAFQPGRFVFPGGRLDPGDQRIALTTDLRPEVRAKAAAGTTTGRARGLALAAIRETFEETGMLLGERGGTTPATRSPVWRRFFAQGVVPRLDVLDFVARAITPPGRVRRFDARFFMADARHIVHTVDVDAVNGELLEPTWVTLAEARARELPAITRLVLDEIEKRLADGADAPRPAPFFVMRRGRQVVLEL